MKQQRLEELTLKAKSIVKKMTLQEKIGQMINNSQAIPRLGIKKYNWWNEALHGVARAGKATMFPQAIGMAATFNPTMLKEVGDIISTEGRAKYIEYDKKNDNGIYKGLTFWSPNINIFRDPRWGRGHETYGEDPYLTSQLAIHFIKGIQGEDEDYLKAAACAKHFVAHSGPEGTRHSFNAEVSQKDLSETYLVAFEQCVKEGHVEAVMSAYNRLNGVACSGNKWLLTDLLRELWGFSGHVVSDCDSILDMHRHHQVTSSPQESAALAVKSGCDLNCGGIYKSLELAIDEGLITEVEIDQAVERLILSKLKLGLIEGNPNHPYFKIPYEVIGCDKHLQYSLEVARQSIVLLKNKDDVLPIMNSKVKRIAVIGPNANSIDVLKGNYHGTSPEYITVLDGIRRVASPDYEIDYALGCHLIVEPSEYEESDSLTEAIIVAEKSDLIILCLGLDGTVEAEEGKSNEYVDFGDKRTNALPERQQLLLKRMVETGKKVIVILMSGSAMDIRYAHACADGILQAWYPGGIGGLAIAEILFGKYSPSGRLPITFYHDFDQLPPIGDYSMENRTYRFLKEEALYPFGYGLSYTQFDYTDFNVSDNVIEAGKQLECSVTVTNTGHFTSSEVVQLYIKDHESDYRLPNYQLFGIKKVELKPNQSSLIQFSVHEIHLSVVKEDGNRIIEQGDFTLYVGGQQPDKRSESLTNKNVLSKHFTIKGNKEII